MTVKTFASYDAWHEELARLAKAENAEWLIAPHCQSYRAAYEQGRTPEDELAALLEMAEWRGCACAGGG